MYDAACNIVFDDLDDSYCFVERLLSAVINEHAPVTHFQVPYRNGELRRNINNKNMLNRNITKKSNTG